MAGKNKIKGLEQLKREVPFSVPENYFNSLDVRIRERIEQSEEIAVPQVNHTLRYIMISGAAAVLAGIAIVSYTLLFPDSREQMSPDEIAFLLEQEIYDMDGYTLESEIEEESIISRNSPAAEYEDEVILYLLDENIELESIVNEL